MPNPRDPQYWRARAEQARAMAEGFKTAAAREQMMEIVAGYERLAKMAEDLSAIPEPKKPS